MRTPLLLLALSIGIGIIYYAGNFTPTATPRLHANPNVQPTTAATAPGTPLTPDQARQLTSKQRLEFIQKGLLIQDEEKQAKYLGDLIEALTKEELSEATHILLGPGNSHSLSFPSHIGETLSIQWGRLDPLGAIEILNGPLRVFDSHAREFMKGWFETDPAAALAWAQEPKTNDNENFMAAEAITQSAAEDPQKLVASLLALPTGDKRVKFCLNDYFRILNPTAPGDAPAIYESLPIPLRQAAWSNTISTMTRIEPQAAVDWLTAHINEPGRDYIATYLLVSDLVAEDPVGTAQWAATFPDDDASKENENHPGHTATLQWYVSDPAAAKAWLQTQPPTLHWVGAALKAIEEKEKAKEPEADKTEE